MCILTMMNLDMVVYVIKKQHNFQKNGIAVHTYQDHYLHGSQEIINQSGQPYKVFTPYYRIWQNYPKETPIKVELSQGRWLNLETPDDVLRTVESFKDEKYQDVATFDEASKQLNRFIQDQLAAYHANRDFPAQLGTSRLSPFLKNRSYWHSHGISRCASSTK